MCAQKTAKLYLTLESSLSSDANGSEDRAVLTPKANAVEVIRAVLIVDDDGSNVVAKALLEHQQASYASVAVIEGTDALELHVKVQNILEGDIGDTLVTLEHGGQLFTDGCRRNFETCFEGCRARAKDSGLDRCHLVSTDITEKKRVQFERKSGFKGLGCVGDNIVNAEEMIAHLNEIVELHILVGEE